MGSTEIAFCKAIVIPIWPIHPPWTRMPVEVLPSLVENFPCGVPPGFIPVPYSKKVLACKARVECKHYIIVRCVGEPSVLELYLECLDLTS